MNELIINNLNWLVPVTITAFFAFLNIWIAVLNYQCSKRQKEIQNDSFCYQLFDKRLKVYSSIQEILSKLISSPISADTLWQPFLQETRDVPFLFGKDIQDKRNDMYHIILRLRCIDKKEKSIFISVDERHRLLDEQTELLKKIMEYIKDLPKIFQPYIGFTKHQVTLKTS
jgi:hypothetical protein